jgi:hypothetical protein
VRGTAEVKRSQAKARNGGPDVRLTVVAEFRESCPKGEANGRSLSA